jgi:hypothetical protein
VVATRTPKVTSLGCDTYTALYPDEFAGSEPLVPGRYEVEWRSAPLVDPVGQPSRSLAATLLGQTMGPTVATDSFTIPERATGGQQDEPRSAENTDRAEGDQPATKAENSAEPRLTETPSRDS